MLIQDRVRMIMKANSLTSSQFADKVGVKRSNLSHVLSGRNKPSLDFLSKIISTFPNVNASWLVTGETREGDFEGVREKEKALQKEEVDDTAAIEKIVVFYRNGSFSSYEPSDR